MHMASATPGMLAAAMHFHLRAVLLCCSQCCQRHCMQLPAPCCAAAAACPAPAPPELAVVQLQVLQRAEAADGWRQRLEHVVAQQQRAQLRQLAQLYGSRGRRCNADGALRQLVVGAYVRCKEPRCSMWLAACPAGKRYLAQHQEG
jgi:hypothetical protein